MNTSPQIQQLTTSTADRLYHVLPNLAVRNEPAVWREVLVLLMGRGLTREEALKRIRFAYTGLLDGDLPPGVS